MTKPTRYAITIPRTADGLPHDAVDQWCTRAIADGHTPIDGEMTVTCVDDDVYILEGDIG